MLRNQPEEPHGRDWASGYNKSAQSFLTVYQASCSTITPHELAKPHNPPTGISVIFISQTEKTKVNTNEKFAQGHIPTSLTSTQAGICTQIS